VAVVDGELAVGQSGLENCDDQALAGSRGRNEAVMAEEVRGLTNGLARSPVVVSDVIDTQPHLVEARVIRRSRTLRPVAMTV